VEREPFVAAKARSRSAFVPVFFLGRWLVRLILRVRLILLVRLPIVALGRRRIVFVRGSFKRIPLALDRHTSLALVSVPIS
jgi:hypothetical protein